MTEIFMSKRQEVRTAVRALVAQKGELLQQAQASGTLARTKLDFREACADGLAGLQGGATKKELQEIIDEEVDAYCADMRLASVTVQAQIERRKPSDNRNVWAVIFGVLVAG